MNHQWSFDALIARYALHPKFREVFVEGDGDIGLYQGFLDDSGRADVLVYPIDSVSIPSDPVDDLQIRELDSRSRRSDVIALALLLEKEAPEADRQVICIADADTQHIQPETFETRFLLFTDYADIESYGFRADIVTKIFRIGGPRLKVLGQDVLAEITGALESLFSLRLANYRLGWGLHWISPASSLEYDDGGVEFDQAGYIHKYLNTKGRLKDRVEFQGAVDNIRAAFSPDPRMQIRGHDYVELLTWYLRNRAYRNFRLFSPEIVRHLLLFHLRHEDLAAERLFITLAEKFPASS